jgi:protein SCO1
MRKYIKVGILILVLVVPALVFLFLKGFGKNHYTLKTYYPKDINEVKVDGKTIYDTVFHKIPSFNLTSQTGAPVTDHTFDNAIYVADFFYTKCPNVCPKMSSQLSRVQEAFEDVPMVKILSYSIDPEYDTAKVLNDYASMYGAKEGKWYFATGSKKEIYDLARNGYFVSATTGTGGAEDFLHSEKFVLVDKDKHIRGYYDGTNQEDVDRLILEIKVLLSAEKNK